MTRNAFAVLLALVVFGCASSSDTAELPDGWIERPPAAENAPERFCFNHSAETWLVAIDDGELEFRQWRRSQRDSDSSNAFDWNTIPPFLRSGPAGYAPGITGVLKIVKLDAGYLVGQDGGEWGGWLRWYSDDGAQVRTIHQQNTSGIVRVGGELIAIAWTRHGWSTTGELQKLVRGDDGRWKVAETLPMSGWPRAFTVTTSNELLVATSEGVTVFHNGKLQVLPAKWDLLNPSSIVRISDRIYVGMQSLVVELRSTPHGVVERWLVPRHCARFVGDDPPEYIMGGWENCRCVPE